jgi:hypothetical protein
VDDVQPDRVTVHVVLYMVGLILTIVLSVVVALFGALIFVYATACGTDAPQCVRLHVNAWVCWAALLIPVGFGVWARPQRGVGARLCLTLLAYPLILLVIGVVAPVTVR